jgi:hypothetical protein
MSFTLNQVTRRAGGGDIVRTRRLEAAEAIIGRGADCDIRLPDLAVSLRHALLRQTAPAEVSLEAIGREPFEVDGRFVTQARLVINVEHQLVFGGHRLTLAPGPVAGDIAVTVTGAASEAQGGEDEERIFSIKDRVFGKRPMAWVLGLLILAVCIAWPIAGFLIHGDARIHADQQWTSGPLSRAHAFLGQNCQACHVRAFVAVRDDACLACHRIGRDGADRRNVAAFNRQWGGPVDAVLVRDHAAHDRLLAATPTPGDVGAKVQALFRRTFGHPNDRCASCHLEHIKGSDASSGAAPAATRAIPALVVPHTCVDCHATLTSRLADTPLRDTPDWGRHPDFRPLVTASPGPFPRFERIALDGRPMENDGLRFSHRIHLSPGGGVARLADELGAKAGYGAPLDCAACHRPDATGRGFKPIEMVRDCSACHSLAFARINGQLLTLPHGHPDQVVAAFQRAYGGGGGAEETGPSRPRPGWVDELRMALDRLAGRSVLSAAAANGVRTAFSPGGACAECHTVKQPPAGSLAYDIAPVYLNQRYMPWGAFDHALPAHRRDAKGRLTCVACHAARTSDDANQVMLPRLSQCASCHGKTPAQSSTAAGSDCAECHSYHAPGQATRKDAAAGGAPSRRFSGPA